MMEDITFSIIDMIQMFDMSKFGVGAETEANLQYVKCLFGFLLLYIIYPCTVLYCTHLGKYPENYFQERSFLSD